MSIASNLQRIINAKMSIRQAVIGGGVDLPEDVKLDEYYKYIDQIGSQPNPSGDGTLADLKLALSADNPAEYYPVGTEIEDTYDGQSNPLIVAQYLDSTNNEKYDGAEGVILIRKFVVGYGQRFGGTSSDVYYNTSTIKDWLDTTYYDSCSDELKKVVAEINIPLDNSTIKSRMFAMDEIEVCANRSLIYGAGIMWDYWKQKTGLTSLNSKSNNGRIMRDGIGDARAIWLRTRNTSSQVCYVDKYGAVDAHSPTSSQCGVLPACFIAKD